MNCSICKHGEHAPGKCKQCNCGEGEICHSDATSTDKTRVVTWENYKAGEVSTTSVKHIKPRKTGSE